MYLNCLKINQQVFISRKRRFVYIAQLPRSRGMQGHAFIENAMHVLRAINDSYHCLMISSCKRYSTREAKFVSHVCAAHTSLLVAIIAGHWRYLLDIQGCLRRMPNLQRLLSVF